MVYAEDILNKSGGNYKPIKTVTDLTIGTASGAAIGLVGGILFAYFQEKKYINCMFIGALSGGLVSRIFLVTSKK